MLADEDRAGLLGPLLLHRGEIALGEDAAQQGGNEDVGA
jgi:hypothetical protein